METKKNSIKNPSGVSREARLTLMMGGVVFVGSGIALAAVAEKVYWGVLTQGVGFGMLLAVGVIWVDAIFTRSGVSGHAGD